MNKIGLLAWFVLIILFSAWFVLILIFSGWIGHGVIRWFGASEYMGGLMGGLIDGCSFMICYNIWWIFWREVK